MKLHAVYCPFCAFSHVVMLLHEVSSVEVNALAHGTGQVTLTVRTQTRTVHECTALAKPTPAPPPKEIHGNDSSQ